MKVFISHSSHDVCVAGKIEEDLRKINDDEELDAEEHVETYLAAKDNQAGDYFAGEIWKNLRGSDHILILLSPASLDSHWVMMEAGGGWLEKNA